MRPYLFEQTWIDLDHVLTIEPSMTHMVVYVEMMFRDEPLRINYRNWRGDSVGDLIKAWQSKPETAPTPVDK